MRMRKYRPGTREEIARQWPSPFWYIAFTLCAIAIGAIFRPSFSSNWPALPPMFAFLIAGLVFYNRYRRELMRLRDYARRNRIDDK